MTMCGEQCFAEQYKKTPLYRRRETKERREKPGTHLKAPMAPTSAKNHQGERKSEFQKRDGFTR